MSGRTKEEHYVGTVRSLKVADIGTTDKEIMPMVLSLATKFYNPETGITREQLVEAGLEGVAIARSKWKRKHKVLFSTLAFCFIRGRMLDTIEAEVKHAERFQYTDPADMVDMLRHVPDTVPKLERASLITRVNAIISREFSTEQQTVLRWYLNGDSMEDIGTALCVPCSHVKGIIDGCIGILRTRLGVK